MGGERFLVADVLCEVHTPDHLEITGLGPSFSDFVTTASPADADVPVVAVHGHYDGLPTQRPRSESLVFDPQANHRLYFEGGQYLLELLADGGTRHCATALFSPDFREVAVHYAPPPPGEPGLDPLCHPIHHFLVTAVLAQGYGLSLHACGVDHHGRGYLFPGHSGAGKSTMGRLWEDEAVVLNDERIVLRERNGQLWIYGTPWLGENIQYANHAVPLHKIFFLEQAPENAVAPLSPADVATRLLSHAVLPLWDRSGMQFVTDFSARVAEKAACHLLGFVPDASVLPFIRCVP